MRGAIAAFMIGIVIAALLSSAAHLTLGEWQWWAWFVPCSMALLIAGLLMHEGGYYAGLAVQHGYSKASAAASPKLDKDDLLVKQVKVDTWNNLLTYTTKSGTEHFTNLDGTLVLDYPDPVPLKIHHEFYNVKEIRI